MKANEERSPGASEKPVQAAPAEREYGRRIDCAPGGPAAPRPQEGGRGTGRLRNPRQDH